MSNGVLRPWINYIGSPYFTSRGRYKPEAWVLHIMDGTLPGASAWFNNNPYQVSAHFGIGKNGKIDQYIYTSNAAHANGLIEPGYTAELIDENGPQTNPNLWTLSCEHEGYSGDAMTPAQFLSSTALCAWAFDDVLFPGGATDVAIDRKHIIGHYEISPQSRARCPGYPESFFRRYIAEVERLYTGKTYQEGLEEGLKKGKIQAADDMIRMLQSYRQGI